MVIQMNNIEVISERILGSIGVIILQSITYFMKLFSQICISMHFSMLQLIIIIIAMRVLIKTKIVKKFITFLANKYILKQNEKPTN